MLAYLRMYVISVLCVSALCDEYDSMQKWKCETDRRQKSTNCTHRGLSEIPNSIFHRDTRKIDLSSNFIERVNRLAFSGVQQLLILDLSRNLIDYLDPMAFEGLGRLEYLNLSYNLFKLDAQIFTPTLFEPLEHLSTFRMQGYNITRRSYLTETYSIDESWRDIDKAFAVLKNLQKLYLDFPDNFVFEEGFATLNRLETISTSIVPSAPPGTCRLSELRNATFKTFEHTGIKELRLTECNILSVERGTFIPLRKLSVLDLSRNKLDLRSAFLSLYGLQNLTMAEINFRSNYGPFSTRFALSKNETIYLETICVTSIDISENFISHIEWYSNVNNLYQMTPSFGKPECLQSLQMSSYRGLRGISRLVLFVLLQFPSIKHLDVSGLSNDPLPIDILSQFMKQSIARQDIIHPSSVVTLNFSNALPSFPGHTLLMFNFTELKTLDISNNINHCDMFSQLFRHVKAITHLSMSRTFCSDFNIPLPVEGGFQSLSDLQEIDLSDNKLTNVQLQKNLFLDNINLNTICLSNNRLQRVPSAAMHLTNISRLDLSVNAFTHLTAEEMSLFDRFSAAQYDKSYFHLNLGRNPLECTCDTLDFIRWISKTDVYLDQVDTYFCVLSNGSRVNLSAFEGIMKNLSVTCISNTWLVIAVIGIFFVLIFIILCYVIYRFRTNLRYWFFTKLQPPIEMFPMRDYVFDAFVAYTEEDYHWVYNDLCSVIENQADPLKLCIHKRDFIPGKPIHENIVDKMRESRKIIFALSFDFLKSSFGPLEIEYAGMKSLEEGREDLIICILIEDIPVRKMPKVLRNFWHKITFLKWTGDPREQPQFWQQLRKAITDSAD